MSTDNDIDTDNEVTTADDASSSEDEAEPSAAEKPDASPECTDSEIDVNEPRRAARRVRWPRCVAFILIPALALLLAVAAACFKWRDSSIREADVARFESAQAARDSTTKLLSYQPDQVDKQLASAQNLLTGQFRDSYSQLTHDVVIPGAKQKHISAVASVPAVASVSADPHHAVVLVFVDQTAIVGNDAPAATASSVRVTLDKVDGRWLISGFDPV